MSTQEPNLSDADRKGFMEFLLTAAGFLGIITAFLQPTAETEALLMVLIVIFVVASINAYSLLLSGQAVTNVGSSTMGYTLSIALMMASFIGLLAQLIGVAVRALSKSDPITYFAYLAIYGTIGIIASIFFLQSVRTTLLDWH